MGKNCFMALQAADPKNCKIGGRNGIDPAFPGSAVTRLVMLFFISSIARQNVQSRLASDARTKSTREIEIYNHHP